MESADVIRVFQGASLCQTPALNPARTEAAPSPQPKSTDAKVGKKEYVFPAEDGPAIIRVTSYRRCDYPLTVVHFPPSDVARFQRYITSQSRFPPVASLGSLARFPLEILLEILRYLDIASLFAFRDVNRQALQVTRAVPGYGPVASHAPEVLLAVIRTELARWYTMGILFELMCISDCQLCKSKSTPKKSFAGYLFLPTLTRCCYRCSQSNPHLELVTLANAARCAPGMSYGKVRRALPVLKVIPGKYGLFQASWKQRVNFVSAKLVNRRFGADPDLSNPRLLSRHQATIAFPYFKVRSKVVEHGASCKGCEVALERLELRPPPDYYILRHILYSRREAIYSEEDFLRHFRYCVGAQVLWQSSRGGTIPIKEPAFTLRGGHIIRTDSAL